MKHLIILLFLVSATNVSLSQRQKIDSLHTLLTQSNEDTNKVKILHQLAYAYFSIAPDSTVLYANKILQLSKKLKYPWGTAKGFNDLAIAWSSTDNQCALEYFEKTLTIMKRIDDLSGVASCLTNIGIIHSKAYNYSRAIVCFNQSLEIAKKINDMELVSTSLHNIGITYEALKDYPQAIKNYVESIEIKKRWGIKSRLAVSYYGISKLKLDLNQYDKAYKYIHEAIRIDIKDGNKRGIARDYLLLGNIYVKKDSLDKALALMYQSLSIFTKLKSQEEVGKNLNSIGYVYLKKNQPNKAILYYKNANKVLKNSEKNNGILQYFINMSIAFDAQNRHTLTIEYAKKALEKALELDVKTKVKDASELLYKAYEKTNQPRLAFKFLITHGKYKDSLINEAKVKQLAIEEAKLDLSEITHDIELLQKENELKKTELSKNNELVKRQKIMVILSLVALFVAIVAGYFIYRLFDVKRIANTKLEILNDEILQQKAEIEIQAENLSLANEEIRTINQSLEATVERRTKKVILQAEKITNYAFSNAHEVRAPLARLMGLSSLFANKSISSEELQEINHKIIEEAHELDLIVRKMSNLLKEEEKNSPDLMNEELDVTKV